MRHFKARLISNLFSPDELAGAALFSDLALYLKEQGADVRVTTTYSYYPAWKVDPEDARHAYRDEIWEGIAVRRIRMHVPGIPTGAGRLLSDLSFFIGLLRFATSREWTPDVVVTASPMFSQCLAQRFLYQGKNIPRLIIVQDFVVDAALELGILKLPGLAGLLRGFERWSFRSAQTLSTISQPMLEKLKSIVGKDRRLVLIPNWIHQSLQQEIDKQTQKNMRRKEKVLFYSGNFGVKQGLPSFLQDFTKLDSGWTFKIHGGGAQLEAVKASVSDVSGARIGGVLSESAYVSELLTCTACLVTQSPGVGANFLPSKLLPALATGTPILAVCEPTSPLGQELQLGAFGVVISPRDPKALQETLDSWKKNPRLLYDLGVRALQWSGRYRRDKILPQYLKELQRLTSTHD